MKVLEAFGEPVMNGGQEAFVFGVLKNINMDGLEIDCLTPYDWTNHEYRHLVERLGGSTYELNLPFQPGKSRMNVMEPFRTFLQHHNYDVIHIHSGSISILAIMASVADRAGIRKVIVHSHSTGENDNIRHKILRLLASLSMRKHVDIYCACSKEAAYWKFEPRYANQAIIIKNGIDIDRFCFNNKTREDFRKKLGISDKDFVIGHVGRFSYEKNQQFLVKVFKLLIEKNPNSVLLLVGDGEHKKNVKMKIEELHLSEKVIMTGNVNNVQDFLQAMDVFVLPSKYEGFAIAAIEAQTAGLPVIISDTVPRDVKTTDEMVFLNLNKTPVLNWVNAILQFKNYKRRGNTEKIKNAGYDINSTVATIRNLYFK
ncbi:MAG: glycosyltransferase [Alphaproteobacteria bacterium]|nr:glycosyltransferase [Alphaproteobacteria bacterium]